MAGYENLWQSLPPLSSDPCKTSSLTIQIDVNNNAMRQTFVLENLLSSKMNRYKKTVAEFKSFEQRSMKGFKYNNTTWRKLYAMQQIFALNRNLLSSKMNRYRNL